MSDIFSYRSLLISCLLASLLHNCVTARLLPVHTDFRALHDTSDDAIQVIPPSGTSWPSHNAAIAAGTTAEREVDLPPEQLALCDCERAIGAPHGLSCEKEGYFISGFERKGSWLIGGGLVPLSHAQCCRPCLPKVLPEDPSRGKGPNDTALAVVSLGCHASTSAGPSMLSCESTGGSLAVGWAQSLQVTQAMDAYYPLGAVECCTPALLLESGDAWELERCDCVATDDVSCGGQETGRLLQGFDHWRLTYNTEFVPVAPAMCCKACLSQTVHPINACSDRNMCSGRGVCILGQCECLGGWHGGDCSVGPFGDGGDLPQWAVALIIIGSCVTLALGLVALSKAMQYLNLVQNSDDEDSEDGDNEEPLLVRLGEDDRGSVGSQDTTDCDSDTEAVIADVAAAVDYAGSAQAFNGDDTATDGTIPARHTMRGIIPTAERHALLHESLAAAVAAAAERHADGETVATESPPLRTLPEVTESAEQAPTAVSSQQQPVTQQVSVSEPDLRGSAPEPSLAMDIQRRRAVVSGEWGGNMNPDNETIEFLPATTQGELGRLLREGGEASDQRTVAQDRRPGQVQDSSTTIKPEEAESSDDGGKAVAQQRGLTDISPLSSMECSVCMSRPVQVVIIPCGHACMCRRCSRRLSRCPVCRKDIFRRQRIFAGG